MSHFTVLVIGDNPELQLAPFQENNMGDCPEEFLEFHDTEDEHIKEYETGTATKIILPDGKMINPWDEKFNKPKDPQIPFITDRVIPANLEQREVPFKTLFKTFEEFMAEWVGSKEKDNKTGRYGYWENPNRKWDFYTLGGRWKGYFKLKSGQAGTLGESGVFDNKARFDADQALKGDIDFEAMMNAKGDEARKRYENLQTLCGGVIPRLEYSWNEVLDGDKFKKLSIEKKREIYHGQAAIKQIKELAQKEDLSKEDQSLLTWMNLEDYQISLDEYVYNARCSAIVTFALIKDGKWFEKGSMGWWGMVSGEKDGKEWNNQFSSLMLDLPDDTLLSVYDCHI